MIWFYKSGETSDRSSSDFIASYEKVTWNARSLRLVAYRTSVESDKICQIWNQTWWSWGQNLAKNAVDLPQKCVGC